MVEEESTTLVSVVVSGVIITSYILSGDGLVKRAPEWQSRARYGNILMFGSLNSPLKEKLMCTDP